MNNTTVDISISVDEVEDIERLTEAVEELEAALESVSDVDVTVNVDETPLDMLSTASEGITVGELNERIKDLNTRSQLGDSRGVF